MSKKIIEEAIESILSQTYSNWELLLIDDGSFTKNTNIALEYVKKYPQKIFFIEYNNYHNPGKIMKQQLQYTKNSGIYPLIMSIIYFYTFPKYLKNH